MKVALVTIAHGEKHWHYVDQFLSSAEHYFLSHDPIVFTDSPDLFWARHPVQQLPLPEKRSGNILRRCATTLLADRVLCGYDYTFYCNVYQLFVNPVGEEVLAEGITAVAHRGYTPGGNIPFYWGGFYGGPTKEHLSMAFDISKMTGPAPYHEESYLNAYLDDHPPAKTLPTLYSFPEPDLHLLSPEDKPKILILERAWRSGYDWR